MIPLGLKPAFWPARPDQRHAAASYCCPRFGVITRRVQSPLRVLAPRWLRGPEILPPKSAVVTRPSLRQGLSSVTSPLFLGSVTTSFESPFLDPSSEQPVDSAAQRF